MNDDDEEAEVAEARAAMVEAITLMQQLSFSQRLQVILEVIPEEMRDALIVRLEGYEL
jgi:hypothetical protein